jgi:TetR/AcrR family transcriptional regulator, transcriptional repressor of bet genes
VWISSGKVEELTAKGARQADRILSAAYRSLAEYGYSGTSMQRIADEAGVNKRMVHYYFETRERLFDEVVRTVGDRLLSQVEDAIAGLDDPADIVGAGVERLWQEVRADPQLQAVYFGLAAESATNPALKSALRHVNNGYRRLIRRLVKDTRKRGYDLRWDEGSLTVLIIAAIQGLTLQFLERGESKDLRRAIEDFKAWLVWIAEPPGHQADTSS